MVLWVAVAVAVAMPKPVERAFNQMADDDRMDFHRAVDEYFDNPRINSQTYLVVSFEERSSFDPANYSSRYVIPGISSVSTNGPFAETEEEKGERLERMEQLAEKHRWIAEQKRLWNH